VSLRGVSTLAGGSDDSPQKAFQPAIACSENRRCCEAARGPQRNPDSSSRKPPAVRRLSQDATQSPSPGLPVAWAPRPVPSVFRQATNTETLDAILQSGDPVRTSIPASRAPIPHGLRLLSRSPAPTVKCNPLLAPYPRACSIRARAKSRNLPTSASMELLSSAVA